MTKEEFEFKVKEVNDVIRSLMYDSGVSNHSSLYGFLFTASSSLDSAIRHLDEFGCLIEIKLNHD